MKFRKSKSHKKIIIIAIAIAAILIFEYLIFFGSIPGPKIIRKGTSFEDAIIIIADTEDEGIDKESEWLYYNACSDSGYPLEVIMQELSFHNDHTYDVISVSCSDGPDETYYFQIDSFYGKWGNVYNISFESAHRNLHTTYRVIKI